MSSRDAVASLDTSIFVHPQALVESRSIGIKSRVWAFAHVMAGAVIGQDCNIGGHTFIESGAVIGNGVTVKNGVSIWDQVTIEDDVFVGPSAVFTNHPKPRAFIRGNRDAWRKTLVKKGATIGAGAVIVCGIEIGEYAFIGAGAVVTKSVPSYALVVGNPGKIVARVCRCLKTKVPWDSAQSLNCPDCSSQSA